MQSNLVSRPDESAGFGTFCGQFCLGRGIFSTLVGRPAVRTFSSCANEEALHFQRTCADFLGAQNVMDRGFWGYLQF